MTIDPLALVGVGGAIGSLCRYQLSRMKAFHGLPLGTLTVNVTGSFLIAALVAMNVSPEIYELLGVGVLGGYTTFSAFGFETFRMIENSDYRTAAGNIMLNVVGSLLAVYAGFKVIGLIV